MFFCSSASDVIVPKGSGDTQTPPITIFEFCVDDRKRVQMVGSYRSTVFINGMALEWPSTLRMTFLLRDPCMVRIT